ncbi:hypothetical protein ACFE04_020613 [Oxalis oulophora]
MVAGEASRPGHLRDINRPNYKEEDSVEEDTRTPKRSSARKKLDLNNGDLIILQTPPVVSPAHTSTPKSTKVESQNQQPTSTVSSQPNQTPKPTMTTRKAAAAVASSRIPGISKIPSWQEIKEKKEAKTNVTEAPSDVAVAGSATSSKVPIIPKKKVTIIDDKNSSEQIYTLRNRFTVPRWKDFKIIGDTSILTWLKKSPLSNVAKIGDEKLACLHELKTLHDFTEMVKKHCQEDDEIIVGFGEEIALHPGIDGDLFMAELKKFVSDLIHNVRVKTIIFCTIPPDCERFSNSHYRSALRAVHQKIWNLRSDFRNVYILDLHSFFIKKYEAEKLPLADIKNRREPKEKKSIEAKLKEYTKEEAKAIDIHLTALVRDHVHKEQDDSTNHSTSIHLITSEPMEELDEENIPQHEESLYMLGTNDFDREEESTSSDEDPPSPKRSWKGSSSDQQVPDLSKVNKTWKESLPKDPPQPIEPWKNWRAPSTPLRDDLLPKRRGKEPSL